MSGVSGLLLAGGASTRMGRDKAELPYRGGSLLQYQCGKLRALGIDDIVVAGPPREARGVRFVSDRYPRRGPLSGLHAGLLAIRNPAALVLSVDTPLVPAALLERLLAAHRGPVTLAARDGRPEPLIGVYDREVAGACERVLKEGGGAVRALLEVTGFQAVEEIGDPAWMLNCNTPQDYARLLSWPPEA